MILLANKPQWRTSNDIVQYLKHRLRVKKCGHAGTLDPMATGLMILATDDDTKKLHDLTWKSKSYLATIDLSAMSDTRDKEYRERFNQYEIHDDWITFEWGFRHRPEENIIQRLFDSIGNWSPVSMPLPPFSAKKVAWQKRYDMARSGNAEIVYQDMIFHDIQIVWISFPQITITCDVASGAYIRSIAYRLWQQLWTGWILVSLQRNSISEYTLDQVVCEDGETKVPYIILK